jgi:hypothetical protein
MKKGDKALFMLPPLAYEDYSGPGVPTGSELESAFAPYVGFGVLMTSKLGTNVILMRYVAAISPMKELKS